MGGHTHTQRPQPTSEIPIGYCHSTHLQLTPQLLDVGGVLGELLPLGCIGQHVDGGLRLLQPFQEALQLLEGDLQALQLGIQTDLSVAGPGRGGDRLVRHHLTPRHCSLNKTKLHRTPASLRPKHNQTSPYPNLTEPQTQTKLHQALTAPNPSHNPNGLGPK